MVPAMKKFQAFLQCQGIHYSLLLFLLVGLATTCSGSRFCRGPAWGVTTRTWFWLAVASAVVHQTYVWLCWRLELYYGRITRWLGPNGFRYYALVFFILFFSRILFVCLLALANQHSLSFPPRVTYPLIGLLSLPVFYLEYSVRKYFGFLRATGIDHFDKAYRNKPLVREGIFRYMRNPMYTLGPLALYIPGIFFNSKAALLVAVFHHGYLWIHYFCTEKPDLQVISWKEIKLNLFLCFSNRIPPPCWG